MNNVDDTVNWSKELHLMILHKINTGPTNRFAGDGPPAGQYVTEIL